MIDLTKETLREGDIIDVRCRVHHDFDIGDDYLHVRAIGKDYDSIAIDADEVQATLITRKWEPEERARFVSNDKTVDEVVTVIAVHGDNVWIEWPDERGNEIVYANDLQPIPDPIEPIKPAPDTYAAEHARSVAFQEAGDPGKTSGDIEEIEF